MNDSKPLFSTTHKKVKSDWNTNTRFQLFNRFCDWVRIRFTRPKLTQSNLEEYKKG